MSQSFSDVFPGPPPKVSYVIRTRNLSRKKGNGNAWEKRMVLSFIQIIIHIHFVLRLLLFDDTVHLEYFLHDKWPDDKNSQGHVLS